MPPETPLDRTLAKVEEIERKVRTHIRDAEARAIISYSGNMFTETAPRLGDHLGQIMIGLKPKTPELRSVQEMIGDMRNAVEATPGPLQVSFLRLSGGPPAGKAIDIKVRGDDYSEIRAAADEVRAILSGIPGVIDIDDDAAKGRNELVLRLDADAINRARLNPVEINRTLQLLVDGLVVSEMRDDGEKLEVRVQGQSPNLTDISQLLDFQVPLADGGSVALNTLLIEAREPGLGNIRHYNFRRAITVQADLEKDKTTHTFADCQLPKLYGKEPDWTRCNLDTKTANEILTKRWLEVQNQHPNINLAMEGELDDLQESMDSMLMLFVAGLGVMFAILGTQFRSYFQPLMILSTVLMAFTGVTFGLLVSNNPLSLYTLYGVVALAGIAVNAAIVLISAGNQRLRAGMSVLHATLYAARRRVIPIMITSLTTIAGLFSLATGLGGKSLIWGPVATAIVWGLAFSTLLTLIVIPLLYRMFMTRSYLVRTTAD
jgi:multidrug efflux pump subunit AcrB